MKKNNLKQLKEMVNANGLEAIECIKYGVQAYNISANEYEVITKFVKVNGRYYFVDRDGNRYLASRYDRAELVARDILDNLRFAEETAYEYVCTLEGKKQVAVECAYNSRFLDFCDLFGFDAESVDMHFYNNGEVYIIYCLKSEQTAKDDAQSEETAEGVDMTAAPAEGLELVEIAGGVAVVGDQRATYKNRKAIKAHGARWNKEAQQWQATTPEAVAALREWFGMTEQDETETAQKSAQSEETARVTTK